VSRRDNIFVLLSSENINGSEVALGMAVLSGLGGRNSTDLARVLLDANVSKNVQEK
jgi:hypothetical protein